MSGFSVLDLVAGMISISFLLSIICVQLSKLFYQQIRSGPGYWKWLCGIFSKEVTTDGKTKRPAMNVKLFKKHWIVALTALGFALI